MITSVRFEGGKLRVREKVRGFDLVPGGSPVPAEFEVETVTSDRDRILDFFCGVAVRAIGKRGRR